jgi:hypothetical protein
MQAQTEEQMAEQIKAELEAQVEGQMEEQSRRTYGRNKRHKRCKNTRKNRGGTDGRTK